MTIRDIQHHLASTIGTDLSHEQISNITEAVTEKVKARQSRPLAPSYPVVYLDRLVVKVRDGGHVVSKAAHIAVGVDAEGVKHVLGIRVQAAERARFWSGVCAQPANGASATSSSCAATGCPRRSRRSGRAPWRKPVSCT
jgi:putative transposase